MMSSATSAKTEAGHTRTLVYPAAGQAHPHASATVDSQTSTDDANGNLTARPGQTLSYDQEDRLTRVVSGTLTTGPTTGTDDS